MSRADLLLPITTLLLAVAACEDAPVSPVGEPGSLTLAAREGGCAVSPDVVVSDFPSLQAAIAGADPGDVIAIDGMIRVELDLFVFTPGLTLTCATPGSGLYTTAADGVFDLIGALADGVTVDRLVLDGTEALDSAMFAFAAGGPAPVNGVRLTNSDVTCGRGLCIFFIGSTNAVVADNRFTAVHSLGTGVHFQGRGPRDPGEPLPITIDGSRIERNVVTALVPGQPSVLGGLRIRDGAGVVIQGNTVLGPWFNSLAMSEMEGSAIAHNVLDGAQQRGMVAATNPFTPISFRDNVVRNNRARGAGLVGLELRWACGNTFAGNNLSGNANDFGAWFRENTGANALRGNGGIVSDDGDFDCDGDGIPDPNSVTGHGPIGSGGPEVGDPVSASNELL